MHQQGDCCQSTAGSTERNSFFTGKLLTADDFTDEQSYFRGKLRRHNRLVHGAGVVCGLEVQPAGGADSPWHIAVSPGYALGPYGDEILVCEPVCIDLASYCPPSPRPGRLAGRRRARRVVFVTIEYAEVPCNPAPIPAGAAGSDAGEPTRIRESFVIRCSADCPDSPSSIDTLCERLRRNRFPEGAPCPGDPRLLLARVTLPAAPDTTLRPRDVDNGVRPSLFSLTMIQEQLIQCCCGRARDRKTGRRRRPR